MTTDLEKERAVFEQWYCTTQTKNAVRARAKLANGVYVDGLTRAAWKAWKVAVARGIALGECAWLTSDGASEIPEAGAQCYKPLDGLDSEEEDQS
jgi:hypothetical protein